MKDILNNVGKFLIDEDMEVLETFTLAYFQKQNNLLKAETEKNLVNVFEEWELYIYQKSFILGSEMVRIGYLPKHYINNIIEEDNFRFLVNCLETEDDITEDDKKLINIIYPNGDWRDSTLKILSKIGIDLIILKTKNN